MESPLKADPQFVTSLARGVEVLRCFTPDRPELGTTEIAGLTGLPQSTVWRLCHTLSQLGCLAPGRNPEKLRIGLGALALGQASLVHSGLAEAAYPAMKDIADRFGGSVSLAGRDRLQMVIVQRAEAPTILRLHLHIGSGLALERSALGWAYFAASSAAERAALLLELQAEHPSEAATIRDQLSQVQADFQRDGYVLNVRTYHPKVNAIGVPVIGSLGRKIMALNCGGAAAMMTVRMLRGPVSRELRSLAERLGRLLDRDGDARAG